MPLRLNKAQRQQPSRSLCPGEQGPSAVSLALSMAALNFMPQRTAGRTLFPDFSVCHRPLWTSAYPHCPSHRGVVAADDGLQAVSPCSCSTVQLSLLCQAQ